MKSRTEFLRTAVLVLAVSLLGGGCVSKPFDVKVAPRVEPEALGPASEQGALSVRARPEWSETWQLETFDANLFLARVLPVRVEIVNAGTSSIAVRKLKFEVTDGQGREFEYLKSEKARDRIEDYYEITVQGRLGRKLYREDFRANSLDLEADLAPGDRRQGFVFFEIPEGVDGPVAATMRVTSKRDKVTVTTRLEPSAPTGG